MYGNWWYEEYGYLDLMLVPCNARREPNIIPPKKDFYSKEVSDKCVGDLAAQETKLLNGRAIQIYNDARFDQDKYDESKIVRQANILTQQFDPRQPNWNEVLFTETEFNDLASFVQYGQPFTQYLLHDMKIAKTHVSYFTNYPNRYKFSSLTLRLNEDQKIINRQTYDILTWLGDLGGLNDALAYILAVLVTPFVSFEMSSDILNNLFMVKPLEPSPESGRAQDAGMPLRRQATQALKKKYVSKGKSAESMYKNLRFREEIINRYRDVVKPQRMTIYRFMCCRDRQRTRYRRLMKISEIKYEKEMDLKRFVLRQRYLTHAVLSLMTGEQQSFLAKLSAPLVREPTDTATASEEEAGSNWGEDKMSYLERMQTRGEPISHRLLKIFEIKQKVQHGENLFNKDDEFSDEASSPKATRVREGYGSSSQVELGSYINGRAPIVPNPQNKVVDLDELVSSSNDSMARVELEDASQESAF